ncbi:MAG: PRC-barrel domain containing protein, partial [Acidobacteriota bacterium]
MSVKHLSGFKIDAEDGEIGSVDSLLMDDQRWVVRYIVVETGSWLAHRKVLIAPSAGKGPEGESQRFPVRLTKKQVEESPEIETDMPVSRKREIELYEHYKWNPYWVGTAAPFAPPFIPLSEFPPGDAQDEN